MSHPRCPRCAPGTSEISVSIRKSFPRRASFFLAVPLVPPRRRRPIPRSVSLFLSAEPPFSFRVLVSRRGVSRVFNAVKNSRNYAVLSRGEPRDVHVSPCFLARVTFPLDVRFPAVSSTRSCNSACLRRAYFFPFSLASLRTLCVPARVVVTGNYINDADAKTA